MSTKPRILVVDDEPRAVELLARTLRHDGEVVTAESADEAWGHFVEGPFDLVISDQRMPGMSGVDLFGRIVERDEQVGRVLLTGYSDLEATVEAINRGRVHAYLHKPCSPDDLKLTARAVLERVNLSRENLRLVEEVEEKNRKLEAAMADAEEAQARVVANEQLAAIGRLIAMIAHDLRSPITLIQSAGSEIQAQAEEHKLEEVASLGHDVQQEAAHMERMCEKLLDVTRASEGSGEARETELDDAVMAALAPITSLAAGVGVEVELDLSSGIALELDEDQLRRGLRNLAQNSLDAMPEGGVLKVQTRRVGNAARVSVVDTGTGIPGEICDRVFEPFVSSGKPGGSGLGLAIVRKVVDDLGGEIEVGKPEGGGTAVHLVLPIPRAAG